MEEPSADERCTQSRQVFQLRTGFPQDSPDFHILQRSRNVVKFGSPFAFCPFLRSDAVLSSLAAKMSLDLFRASGRQ